MSSYNVGVSKTFMIWSVKVQLGHRQIIIIIRKQLQHRDAQSGMGCVDVVCQTQCKNHMHSSKILVYRLSIHHWNSMRTYLHKSAVERKRTKQSRKLCSTLDRNTYPIAQNRHFPKIFERLTIEHNWDIVSVADTGRIYYCYWKLMFFSQKLISDRSWKM